MLQEGIYYDSGQRPPPCFSIMFLRARAGVTAGQVGKKLAELWSVYAELKRGRIGDLPGVTLSKPQRRGHRRAGATPSHSDLSVLIGYGVKTFVLTGARRPAPDALKSATFRAPTPDGN